MVCAEKETHKPNLTIIVYIGYCKQTQGHYNYKEFAISSCLFN